MRGVELNVPWMITVANLILLTIYWGRRGDLRPNFVLFIAALEQSRSILFLAMMATMATMARTARFLVLVRLSLFSNVSAVAKSLTDSRVKSALVLSL